MARFHQLLFAVSIAALCWYGMQAVHELGHVLGAVSTGGTVQRVVLDPRTISRTDVSPNPHPAWVVWAGPILGCCLPLALAAIIPRSLLLLGRLARFFAGFCLVANGAYIALGSLDGVGDCGEMLRTGAPLWTMLAFGSLAAAAGLYLWHTLGSPRELLNHPERIKPATAWLAAGIAAIAFGIGIAMSPP